MNYNDDDYEFTDSDWIWRFNDMSHGLYYDRYIDIDIFQPLSAGSSSNIVLPSDRYEIKIGLNLFSEYDKNRIKFIDEYKDQILAVIVILVGMIRHRYEIMKEQCIQNAIKYYEDIGEFFEKSEDRYVDNITTELIYFLQAFDYYEFPFQDLKNIIEKNLQKHDKIRNRLLGCVVPFLVETRDEREFNKDIQNIAEILLKHDIDMIIMDIATENQRRYKTK